MCVALTRRHYSKRTWVPITVIRTTFLATHPPSQSPSSFQAVDPNSVPESPSRKDGLIIRPQDKPHHPRSHGPAFPSLLPSLPHSPHHTLGDTYSNRNLPHVCGTVRGGKPGKTRMCRGRP